MSSNAQPSRTPRSVLAALDFSSPLAFRVPTPEEATPAQDQIETVWTGSIIQMSNGDWLQYAGMDWNSRNILDSLVLYSRDGESSEPRARPKVQALLDVAARERICKKIILGFLGGTFKDKDGTLVQVKSLERSNGKLSHVKYALVDDDGTELVEEPATTMFKFTSKFGTPLGEPADAGVDDFDFAKYPLLLNILRASKLLEESATLMSRSDAAGFLTGMRAREDVQNAELSRVASEAEAAAAAEKASPALSRLKRAATGNLATQTPSKKGRVARVLALGLGSRDEMAPQAEPDQLQNAQPQADPSAAAGSSKRKKNAAAGSNARKKQARSAGSGGESDDSDSGSSDDESDEPDGAGRTEPQAKQPKQGGKEKAYRIPKSSHLPADPDAASERIFDAPPAETPLLLQFTPRDVGQLRAASVIFDHARIRQAAGAEPMDDSEPPPGQRARLVLRYEHALARLKSHLGSAWASVEAQVQAPPKDMSALYMVTEHIINVVTQVQMGIIPSSASLLGTRPSSADASASEQGAKHSHKPAEGISADKRPWAVLPGTAEKLHAAGERVRAAAATGKPEAITSLIGESPANLRDELRAALMSNGAVDNFGETAPERRALPSSIADMIRVTLGAIAHAIELVPKADKTGRCVLEFHTVHELARKVAEGRGSWSEFSSVARKMRGGQAAPDVSAGISDTWSLMKPAYEALFKTLAIEDQGLEAMGARILASSAQSRLPPDELARWAASVVSAYTSQVHKFRQSPREGTTPTISAAIAEREDAYTFDSYRQALSALGKVGKQPAKPTGGKPEDTPSGKGKGKPSGKGKGSGKPAGGKPDETPPASNWTEKKHAIPEAKFKALRQAAITTYPGACAMWLIAKCSRGSACGREHKRPHDFPDFLDQNGLNLDGSEKCEAPPRTHTPIAHASSMLSSQHAALSSSGDMGSGQPAEPAQSRTLSPWRSDEHPSTAAHTAEADADLQEKLNASASTQPSEGPERSAGRSEAQSPSPSQQQDGLRAQHVLEVGEPRRASRPSSAQSGAADSPANGSLRRAPCADTERPTEAPQASTVR